MHCCWHFHIFYNMRSVVVTQIVEYENAGLNHFYIQSRSLNVKMYVVYVVFHSPCFCTDFRISYIALSLGKFTEMSVSAASTSNANSSNNEPVTTSGSTLGASENPSASDEKASVMDAENIQMEGSQNGEGDSSEQHVDDGDNDDSATDVGAAAPSTNGWESPRQVHLMFNLMHLSHA